MSPIRRLRLCLRLSTGTGPVTRDVSCGEELRKRLLRSSWRQEMGRILVFLLATLAACAQQASSVLPEQTIRVPLKTARGTMQSMGVGIALNADASGQLKAILPGGLETRIERMPAPLAGVVIHIPDADPSAIVLLNEQSSLVEIKRTVGELRSAPYLLRSEERRVGKECRSRR